MLWWLRRFFARGWQLAFFYFVAAIEQVYFTLRTFLVPVWAARQSRS